MFIYVVCCCFYLFVFRNNSFRISRLSNFVNNFFKIFKKTFFKNFNAERGIWTLAPVARPTPLAGAPLQPLEYFCWTYSFYETLFSQCNGYYKWEFSFCQSLFLNFFRYIFLPFSYNSHFFNLLYSTFTMYSISCIYTYII